MKRESWWLGAEFEGMGRLLRCFALIQLLHRDVNSPKIRAKALFSGEPTSRARIFITLRLAFSICPSPRILRQLPAGIPKKRKGRNPSPDEMFLRLRMSGARGGWRVCNPSGQAIEAVTEKRVIILYEDLVSNQI